MTEFTSVECEVKDICNFHLTVEENVKALSHASGKSEGESNGHRIPLGKCETYIPGPKNPQGAELTTDCELLPQNVS